MWRLYMLRWIMFVVVVVALAGCASSATLVPTPVASPQVLAAETFLADIARNVAGDRVKVESLMPLGLDPHGFEPTPSDIKRVADSQILIVNGAGFEGWLQKVLDNADGQRTVIEAAAGLTSRTPREGELAEPSDEHHHESDPHFWLDPNNVIKYVENIRDGLIQADPGGAKFYAVNADAYIARLKELDAWIVEQVKQVPEDRRLLVTNHESFGYFADRYGFRIVGTIVPSVDASASPSAQQFAQLTEMVKQTGAPAIFLETGSNPQMANQLANETGVKVVVELYTHSITDAAGPAPTYIDMIKYNVQAIVDALE